MSDRTHIDDNLFNELFALVDKSLDGTATDEQQQRLELLVQSDPSARLLYLRLIREARFLHRWAQHDPAAESTSSHALDVAASQTTRGFFTSTVRNSLDWRVHPVQFGAFALTLTLALWVGFWAVFLGGISDPRRPRVAERPEWIDGTIARLAWINRAHWEGFVPSGRGMNAGRKLVLASGLAEIRYKTGAIVILEGPAEFIVGSNAELGTRSAEQSDTPSSEFPVPSSNRGYLALGKLVARVEGDRAKGFTIGTPSARVEDLGTEFGLEVQRDGAVEVAVLAGAVEIVREARGDWPEERTRLTKGQGAFIEAKDGVISRRGQVDFGLVAKMQSRLSKIRQAQAVDTLGLTAGHGELFYVNIDDADGAISGRLPIGYEVYTGQGRKDRIASALAADGVVGVTVTSPFFRNSNDAGYGAVTSLAPSHDPQTGYNAVVNSGALVNHEEHGPIVITLSGLKAGQYKIRFFMHNIFNHRTGEAEPGLWDISGTANADNVPVTYGFNDPASKKRFAPTGLSSIGQTVLTFVIDSDGDAAQFTFAPEKLASNLQLWVNGFELTPATVPDDEGEATETN